jgi:hypothetical protein
VNDEEARFGAFVPLLLVVAMLLLWFGFQTVQLVKEREHVGTLRANQATIYANAQKMRAQLDAIAADTARLAQAGNPHAAQIVEALRARGITINPNAGASPAQK